MNSKETLLRISTRLGCFFKVTQQWEDLTLDVDAATTSVPPPPFTQIRYAQWMVNSWQRMNTKTCLRKPFDEQLIAVTFITIRRNGKAVKLLEVIISFDTSSGLFHVHHSVLYCYFLAYFTLTCLQEMLLGWMNNNNKKLWFKCATLKWVMRLSQQIYRCWKNKVAFNESPISIFL